MHKLKIEKSVIKAGVERPFKFLHVSDPHIDIRSIENFSQNTEYFEKAMKYAKENDLMVLCTGDNFIYYSEDNKKYALEKFPENAIFIPGNHDFCDDIDDLYEGDINYCEYFINKWSECYKQEILFDSKIVNGVNFVTLLDIYYEITAKQLEFLKNEVAKGYPVILCMHVPFFVAKLADSLMAEWAKCGYQVAPPESYYKNYSEKDYSDQVANEATLRAVEYITNEPAIKAIVAGHVHLNFDGFSDSGKRQICTGELRHGHARVIEVI